jgi:4-aminobutyrate aminotransferase-like enzyme
LTPARIKFCLKVADLSPGQLKGGRVVINNEGGGFAIESAMKLAMIASKGRDHFLTFFHGYHGSSLATATASQPFHVATRYRPFGIDRFTRIPYPQCYHCLWKYKNGLYGKRDPDCNLECFDLVEKYLMGMTTMPLAGVILEPCQGAGGHYPAPPEFLQRLKEVCAREKIFVIYDESQTCVWRTGKYFTLSEKYEKELGIDVSPDMIAYTKAIGGGFPLGAMVATHKIKKRFSPTEEHTTFSSPPVACAAAVAAFEVIERDKINENCEERGKQITKRLLEFQEKYDVIGDIRGPGLFIGIELVKDRETREPFTHLMEDMLIEGAKQQVFFGPSMPIMSFGGMMVMRNLIKIKPPLLISEEDADFVCDRFESTLKASLNNVSK